MGVTAAWEDDQKTIIRLAFTHYWTNEELDKAGMALIMMIRSVSNPMYVTAISASARLRHWAFCGKRDLNQMRPPNWAAGITITNDSLVLNLLDLFRHSYPGRRGRNVYAVRSNLEALQLIDQLKKEKRVG